ncbi:MAG: FliH/SctL family protein [Waltera sp.]
MPDHRRKHSEADAQEAGQKTGTAGSTGGSGTHRGCTKEQNIRRKRRTGCGISEAAGRAGARSSWTQSPDIYEHIFDVDLHSYREVLCYLISATMRKTEDNRSFLVHVSKEDYPYVSMQKKQIMAGATAPNSTVEIVEDMTLGKGECMIETESGIFDCGLGTQLSELRQKLKLLSYEG